MLHWNKKVFDPALLEFIEGDIDKSRYKNAVENFNTLYGEKKETITDIITKIWYNYGYRFETLKTEAAQKYAEIYDYIFEVARRSEEAGKNMAEFIDEIETKRHGGKNDLEIPIERSEGASVTIMTIHKSKGLQFPIVFVPFCGEPAREPNESKMIYYKKIKKNTLQEFELQALRSNNAESAESEIYELLSLNLPPAPELPINGIGNYFYRRFKYDNTKMARAENKRLLYVAATRAESTLYWTATLPPLTKTEKENKNYNTISGSIEKRLLLFKDKTVDKCESGAKNGSAPPLSFLELLSEPLAESIIGNKKLWTIEEIKDNSKEKIGKAYASHKNTNVFSKQTLCRAKELYANANVEKEAAVFIEWTTPTAGFEKPESRHIQKGEERPEYSGGPGSDDDRIAMLLKQAGVSSGEFGEAAHTIIEDKLNGVKKRKKTILPDVLAAEAEKMADSFLSSELGKKCHAAEWREIEYPFMSLVIENNAEEYLAYPRKRIFISGRMDLVFKHDKTIYVIDFKTDRVMIPSQHVLQLKRYKDAIVNLYPNDKENIKTYLFYLRHGSEILCS
jgi:ATP-dependent helicase/nuclease subunit A